jgi:GT2 family glycosyltransferase
VTVNAPDCDYEIVIVSYRSRAPLSRLLDALVGEKVVVVDNAARVEPVRDLTSAHDAAYVDPGGNVGFAAAANLGAAEAEAEVVIFVNPDCLPAPNVLQELADSLCRDPSLGSCSPRLIGVNGASSTVGGGWAPTLPRCVAHAIGLPKVIHRSGIWVTPRHGEVLEVGWLAGTCLAVRRSAFRSVGGFDTTFFLYNEDVALGERLARHGLRQLIRADLSVEHAGGQSSSGSPVAIWLMRGASMGLYIRDRNSPAAALVMRLILSLGWCLRAAACAVAPSRRVRVTELMTYVVGIMRPTWASTRATTFLTVSGDDETGMPR